MNEPRHTELDIAVTLELDPRGRSSFRYRGLGRLGKACVNDTGDIDLSREDGPPPGHVTLRFLLHTPNVGINGHSHALSFMNGKSFHAAPADSGKTRGSGANSQFYDHATGGQRHEVYCVTDCNDDGAEYKYTLGVIAVSEDGMHWFDHDPIIKNRPPAGR